MGVEIIAVVVPKKLALKRQITRCVEVEKAMRRKKKKQSGFGIIIAKTGGHVLSP